MRHARKQMEEIGFLKSGEHPYFQAGDPIHVLGFKTSPLGSIWDPLEPDVVLAGRLVQTYQPGADVLLSGPMARTVHARGTARIFNLFGLICATNAFTLWHDTPDTHGCRLYILVNDGTRKLPQDALLTDRIKTDPPFDPVARKAYAEQIVKAVRTHLFDNSSYIEKSLVWSH